ncbi:MAG: PIN domain-containing protein [Thermoproteus sp.]|jgi:hypothetical protein|nr:PIN domain-containing protein [Thermoproteus sp.]MDT7881482.1 PIN domain-containing protein [Thermoproteus sp.]
MLREVRTLARLGSFVVVPLVGKVMRESIAVVLRHHVYVVDALQVASCKYVNCEAFYTADKELAEIAEAEDVASVLLGRRPPSRAFPGDPVTASNSSQGGAALPSAAFNGRCAPQPAPLHLFTPIMPS